MSGPTYTCRCGELGGVEHCEWEGSAGDLVVVEYMPECARASHEKAGNRGVYPLNGAERAAVHWECAQRLCDDWCHEVQVRDVTSYAEQVHS